jgi:hypothetical protein
MKGSGRIPEFRDLTDPERLLLERLLVQGTPGAQAYAEQLAYMTVVSRCSCGCPTIDLAVRGQAASAGSPSEILAEATGMSSEKVRFGIILHARAGLLSELEVYAMDRGGAFTLPEIDRIEFL